MKYNVTLSYHGSITLSVEAENEQKALEAARNQVGAMSDSEFNEAIDLMEHDTDVHENVPEDKNWVKPRFTKNDILKGAKYDEDPDVHKVHDSMELESCDLAWLKNTVLTRSGETLKLEACLGVRGEVRVTFRNEDFRRASDMPQELLDCYHNEKNPQELDPDYYVGNNNWFELFLKITKNGITINDDSYVVDDLNENDNWKDELADELLEILNEDDEALASLFKKDDQVRWDDPDLTLRERTMRISEKKELNALITDGTFEGEFPYSELLLQQA